MSAKQKLLRQLFTEVHISVPSHLDGVQISVLHHLDGPDLHGSTLPLPGGLPQSPVLPELHHLDVGVGVPGTLVGVVVPARDVERLPAYVHVHDQVELQKDIIYDKEIDDDDVDNDDGDDNDVERLSTYVHVHDQVELQKKDIIYDTEMDDNDADNDDDNDVERLPAYVDVHDQVELQKKDIIYDKEIDDDDDDNDGVGLVMCVILVTMLCKDGGDDDDSSSSALAVLSLGFTISGEIFAYVTVF